MALFDDFWDALKPALSQYAQTNWAPYQAAASSDASAYLQSAREDLQNWTAAVKKGLIQESDLKELLAEKEDLATLVALKQLGLEEVALARFIDGLQNVVVSTAETFFRV
ncbi:MAG TPA: hypothetical protein VK914_02190 [bacterium]|jgi:hypothetical protein|nr:hypothetical protein [bacterium]